MSAANKQKVVLIVEDQWLLREDAAHSLHSAGWEVIEAGSGEQALQVLLERRRVDAIFTDIQLGGTVTGWDVAEAFRATQPDIPVIYASGNPIDPVRQVTPSRFFTKPYAADAIIKALGPIK